MSFLPIVERELRVGARRSNTYWIRFGAALCILGIWLALTLSSRTISTPALSQNLFTAFGVIALGFCLLAGIFLTADCLSEEKREGTLGLLFLTDLKGYDVVLGKLFGTSIRSFNGLIAIFPLLGLPLLMGGVTRGEFYRVILALLATLFLSLSLGMFMSAINREGRQAMSSTFLGLLILAALLPATWWLGTVLRIAWPITISLLPSPVHLFASAFDSHYRTSIGPREFWTSLVIVLSLALSSLAIAAVVLPKTWQEGKSLGEDPGGKERTYRSLAAICTLWATTASKSLRMVVMRYGFVLNFSALFSGTMVTLFIVYSDFFSGAFSFRWTRFLLFGSLGYLGIMLAIYGIRAGISKADRKLLLEENPFLWLASRDNLTKVLIWIIFSFLSFLWACFFVSAIVWKTRDGFVLSLLTAYAIHQVFKLMTGLDVTRQLGEARRNGMLELLLVTPLEEKKIIYGQEQALQMQFKGLRRLLLVINFCLCAGVILTPNTLSTGNEQGVFLELFLGGILMLLLDFKALSSVGILMALRYHRHSRAALATFARVMGLPWATVFLIFFMAKGGALNGTDPGAVFALWFGVGIIADLLIGAGARATLTRGVRQCLESKQSTVLEKLRFPAQVDYNKSSPVGSSI
jgi:hypothetical protein